MLCYLKTLSWNLGSFDSVSSICSTCTQKANTLIVIAVSFHRVKINILIFSVAFASRAAATWPDSWLQCHLAVFNLHSCSGWLPLHFPQVSCFSIFSHFLCLSSTTNAPWTLGMDEALAVESIGCCLTELCKNKFRYWIMWTESS